VLVVETLKGVTQGHLKWCRSKALVQFPIRIPFWFELVRNPHGGATSCSFIYLFIV